MLSVRELKGLTRRLDDAELARQLGPFVLVQRPLPDAKRSKELKPTARLPDMRVPPAPKGVFDFEDLWVASLPPIVVDDSTRTGRAPDCDVIIDDETVPKVHARIEWKNELAVLEDLGSSNGTFLNTVRLRERQQLKDNDVLAFGHVHV
ncbi:MAG: FHA domain-containing protein, partial [Archangium sp.]